MYPTGFPQHWKQNPSDIYRMSKGLADGMYQTDSGLLIPVATALDNLKKAQELRRIKRKEDATLAIGSFFSDWDMLTGFTSSGAVEKPVDQVSYSFLRDAFRYSALDLILVNKRIQQAKAVARRCLNPQVQAGFRVVSERWLDPSFVEDDETRARCKRVEDIILQPNVQIHPRGFEEIMVNAVREELVIDRKCVVLARDRVGRVQSYWMVDGATILPRPVALWPWWMKQQNQLNESEVRERYMTLDWNQIAEQASEDKDFNPMGLDLTQYQYVQEIDSRIMNGWRMGEMDVDISQPTIWVNHLPYGQGSLLEQSLEITAAWVNAWSYNQHLFRTNYPERIVTIRADYDPNALEAAKRRIFSEGGPASWERILLMPLDEEMEVQSIPLRDTPRDLMFAEMLQAIASLKAANFGFPKETLGLEFSGGGRVQLSMRGESQVEFVKEEAEQGKIVLLDGVAAWLTRTIVKSHYPDLVMIWDGLQPENERERIELTVQKVSSYMTIDEARAVENLDPLPNGMGAYPLPVVEQILKNEADLIEAQAEMAVMGGEAESRIKLPNDTNPRSKPRNDSRKQISGEFGTTGSPGKQGKPPSRKSPDEPGEARRVRDRAKTQMRSPLETAMKQRTSGTRTRPQRAREEYHRRRSRT